jgi:hypothetical protein
MTDNTQGELSKEKGKKIFHNKLHGKLTIYLYLKGSNICSEMKKEKEMK